MLRLLIILAVGFAAYAAFGQSTTTVRPNKLQGGYDVTAPNGTVTRVRPNALQGGYDVHSPKGGVTRVRKNSLQGGYDVHHPTARPAVPLTPVLPTTKKAKLVPYQK